MYSKGTIIHMRFCGPETHGHIVGVKFKLDRSPYYSELESFQSYLRALVIFGAKLAKEDTPMKPGFVHGEHRDGLLFEVKEPGKELSSQYYPNMDIFVHPLAHWDWYSKQYKMEKAA